MTTTHHPDRCLCSDCRVPARLQRIRAVNSALAGTDALFEQTTKLILHVRSNGITPNNTRSSDAAGAIVNFERALAALDELYETIRPAVEAARDGSIALRDELAAEEVAAAKRETADRRRLAIEAKVAAGVQRREAERLADVEAEVRAELGVKVGAR